MVHSLKNTIGYSEHPDSMYTDSWLGTDYTRGPGPLDGKTSQQQFEEVARKVDEERINNVD